MWDFHDYPGAFSVYVKQTIKNQKIVFEWSSPVESSCLTVKMDFERLGDDITLVKISEAGWISEDQPSLDESYRNCQGWTQMICCLKVYLEYNKNLREFFY